MIPPIFSKPAINPSVAAFPDADMEFAETQAGINTAGVKDPKVSMKVLYDFSEM
jgi:hypothetical protein